MRTIRKIALISIIGIFAISMFAFGWKDLGCALAPHTCFEEDNWIDCLLRPHTCLPDGDPDRLFPINKEFGERCHGLNSCNAVSAEDSRVSLICTDTNTNDSVDGGVCVVSSIENCTEFVSSDVSVSRNDCVECDTGYYLVDGRCNADISCPFGEHPEQTAGGTAECVDNCSICLGGTVCDTRNGQRGCYPP